MQRAAAAKGVSKFVPYAIRACDVDDNSATMACAVLGELAGSSIQPNAAVEEYKWGNLQKIPKKFCLFKGAIQFLTLCYRSV